MVQKEEAQAAIKARETQAIADDAQRDLNEALPALVCVTNTHTRTHAHTYTHTHTHTHNSEVCHCLI